VFLPGPRMSCICVCLWGGVPAVPGLQHAGESGRGRELGKGAGRERGLKEERRRTGKKEEEEEEEEEEGEEEGEEGEGGEEGEEEAGEEEGQGAGEGGVSKTETEESALHSNRHSTERQRHSRGWRRARKMTGCPRQSSGGARGRGRGGGGAPSAW